MSGPQGTETQTPKQCRRRTGCGRKGGWQGEAESGIVKAPLNSREGISPPDSGDGSFTAPITLSRDAGLQGLPSRSVKCSGVKGNPPYLGCHFPLLEPRDHRGTAFPSPPRQTLLGQTPRKGAARSETDLRRLLQPCISAEPPPHMDVGKQGTRGARPGGSPGPLRVPDSQPDSAVR